MNTADPAHHDAMTRARAWHHGAQATVCDFVQPWAHGTVVRATLYPSYFDYNAVRVEDDPAMSFEALTSFADEALDGLGHRRLDFELIDAAEPLRAAFARRGWRPMRLLWLRHAVAPGIGPESSVEEVPYDAVADLRASWHREDFPDQEPTGYHAQAREVALLRDARVLAMHEGGVPVAFAQLEAAGTAAEITQVYVDPQHRGRGRGTVITRAAIEATRGVEDLWICADDEGRPKKLYARLGFRPAWRSMEFLRLP